MGEVKDRFLARGDSALAKRGSEQIAVEASRHIPAATPLNSANERMGIRVKGYLSGNLCRIVPLIKTTLSAQKIERQSAMCVLTPKAPAWL